MKVEYNKALSKISWLSTSYSGKGLIKKIYYPEDNEELVDIIAALNKSGEDYLIIGHTSNMYFSPDFVCEIMISTRQLTRYDIVGDMLVCSSGVKVSSLAKDMVSLGYTGFEGLVDLPGTVGGAIYGNAGCYGCLLSDTLVKVDVITQTGKIETLFKDDFKFSNRSSILKRKEFKATIVRVYFKLNKGDRDLLKQIAEMNHENRKHFQPSPSRNLGSIYANEEPTYLFYFLRIISHLYGFFTRTKNLRELEKKRKNVELKLMGGAELSDYVDSWNRFIWKDAEAHVLFWKYHKIHSKLFRNSHFEIEIFK